MLRAYLTWVMTGGRPVVMFYDGVRISEFSSFSEYWLRRTGVDPVDLNILGLVSSVVPSNEKKIAIDVGANLGTFSLAMAKAGFDRVYAFEPIPETHRAFLANLERNPGLSGRIEPEFRGLAAHPGELTFEIHPNSAGQNKIASQHNPVSNSFSLRCAVTTIDCYLEDLDQEHIALLKLDVEGYECEVLKGAEHSLRCGRIRFIYSEVIPHALVDAGSSLEEFDDLLSSYGFEAVIVSPEVHHRLVPATLHDALISAGARRNVLFRRREDGN